MIIGIIITIIIIIDHSPSLSKGLESQKIEADSLKIVAELATMKEKVWVLMLMMMMMKMVMMMMMILIESTV